MSNGILVFIENKGGTANRSSFEAIAAAQAFGSQLQQPVSAVVLGADTSSLAQEIAAYDIARVITVNDPKLADYTPDAYADALEQVVKQTDPSLVFLTHTYQVRDFAPKLAARFQKSLISDCIRAKADNGKIGFTSFNPFQNEPNDNQGVLFSSKTRLGSIAFHISRPGTD